MKADNLHDLIEIRYDIQFAAHTLRLLSKEMHAEDGDGRTAFLLTYLSNILDSAMARILDIENYETVESTVDTSREVTCTK